MNFVRFIYNNLPWRLRWHFQAQLIQRMSSLKQPSESKGTIIFAGLSTGKFTIGGKVTATEYLPAFANACIKHGFQVKFTTDLDSLERMTESSPKNIVIMVYREVDENPDNSRLRQVLSKSTLVFNHPTKGEIISSKKSSHAYLTERGIQMPAIQTSTAKTQTFSNDDSNSGASVNLINTNECLDESRYNTEFIDTRVSVNGLYYYTSIRLMCVGGEITHAYVRARPTSDGDPSVHAKDTPIDSQLLNTLHDKLVKPNIGALEDVSHKIYLALGPGFYSHDVLVSSENGEIYIAEPGYKFDDAGFRSQMTPVLKEIRSMGGFHTPSDTAINSVPAFLRIINGVM